MGFPASGVESLYRNPKSEVIRFLEYKHKNHYKLWNLCAEKTYETADFHNRVERMPFYDHQAPPIDIMRKFCISVDEWLKQDPSNVAVVHCKAGKGRTGVMICCYMVYCGLYSNPAEALQAYAVARTRNVKGVTIPSQIRYVHYFHRVLQQQWDSVPAVQRVLHRITFTPPLSGNLALTFVIQNTDFQQLYDYEAAHAVQTASRDMGSFTLDLADGVPIAGDLLFVFKNKTSLNKKKKVFHCWINTAFVDDNTLTLDVASLDGPDKSKKKRKLFRPGFKMEFFFKEIPNNSNGNGASSNLIVDNL